MYIERQTIASTYEGLMGALWLIYIALIAGGGAAIYYIRKRRLRQSTLLTACVFPAALVWLAYDSKVSFGVRNANFWVCSLSSVLLVMSLAVTLVRKRHNK